MLKEFKVTNIVLLAIGIAYIYLAFALIDAKEECKECEESKKNFIPIEVPSEE